MCNCAILKEMSTTTYDIFAIFVILLHLSIYDRSKLSQNIYVIAYFSPLKAINVSLETIRVIDGVILYVLIIVRIFHNFMETDDRFIKKQSVLIK